MKPVEQVGVLMIHGIGQQARYGHLEPEVSEIARALGQQAEAAGWPKPVIRARSRAPKLRGATNATWNDGKGAPIVLELELPEKRMELHFREVWWADLGDRTSTLSLARFYAWALGMWLKPESRKKHLGGQSRMRFPEIEPPSLLHKLTYRIYLAVVGLIVFLPIPLSIVLRLLRIDVPPVAKLLAEYLGDVKLYQDQVRVGAVRIEDLGLPPRVSIRARMIQSLVEMSLSNYSRWYVCAHSLGSVIAFNGLMETEQSLPNYLDDHMLARARDGGLLIRTANEARQLNEKERMLMCPPRPGALEPDHVLDRSRLFAGLRGLLTYGCPLERFRLLWPAIVPLNMEAERGDGPPAFTDLTWINLLDPSDPVASRLKSFCKKPGSKESHPSPINIPYRCPWPQLGSHISYLRLRKKLCAAHCLGAWLLAAPAEIDAEKLWSQISLSKAGCFVQEVIELLGWLVMLALGSTVTALVFMFCGAQLRGPVSLPSWLQLAAFLENAKLVATLGLGIMLPSGIALYLWQKHLERRLRRDDDDGQKGGPGPSSLPALAPRPAE